MTGGWLLLSNGPPHVGQSVFPETDARRGAHGTDALLLVARPIDPGNVRLRLSHCLSPLDRETVYGSLSPLR
jgi:hypothetical protein